MKSGPTKLRRFQQRDRYSSPWTLRHKIRIAGWCIAYAVLFRPTPKFLWRWRAVLLRAFGARITGSAFVASNAEIRIPWQLTMHDRACIGERAVIYNLGQCVLAEGATVAQEVYLCGGTHDFDAKNHDLLSGDIFIGEQTFIGARAFVMPGVTIGANAVIGACSVVTDDIGDGVVAVGNPCKPLRKRENDR